MNSNFADDMKTTGTFAVSLALIIGIIGVVMAFLDYGFSIILAIIAVILGATSRQMVKGISDTKIITWIMFASIVLAVLTIVVYLVR